MPEQTRLNGGVRQPNDYRKIRFADDYPNRRGITVFYSDECPVTAAIVFAKMTGRVIEIFRGRPPLKRLTEIQRIPPEYLERIGQVRDGDPLPVPESELVTPDDVYFESF